MSLQSHNYEEIFCDAVNQLIQSSLQGLSFDITKNCSITDISERKYGKYQVSDGTIKFTAYTNNTLFYELDDTVLVTVPEGDFNRQAVIIGKLANPLTGSLNIADPFENFLKGTSNICPVSSSTFGLCANGDQQLIQLMDVKKDFFGFSQLGIKADFSTLLQGQNIIRGAYGIKIILHRNGKENSVMDLTFSSYDMLGNPYEFDSYFNQQMVFNIPKNMNHITGIQVYFYQDGKFEDGNNNRLVPLGVNDLFVKNVEVYFGYESISNSEDLVEIASADLTYSTESNHLISLRWFHKEEDGDIIPITASNWNSADYTIRWYQHQPGCPEEQTDEYGGPNWKVLPSQENEDYPFSYSFTPSLLKTAEKIKAIAFVKSYPLHNNSQFTEMAAYESNILTFENIDEETEGGSKIPIDSLSNHLSLYFEDGSEGNYFLYDQNGLLINRQEIGSGYSRRLSLRYGGLEIDRNSQIFNSIKSITWRAPKNSQFNSMLIYDDDKYKELAPNLLQESVAGACNEIWNTTLGTLIDYQDVIMKLPIPTQEEFGDYDELMIYQDIEHSELGTFKFSTNIQLFNNNEDMTDEIRNQKADVSLMIFLSQDGLEWMAHPYKKIFQINCGSEQDISHSFKINNSHKYLRVAIGYYKDQPDIAIVPSKKNQNFFVWGGVYTTLQADLPYVEYVAYPEENELGEKIICSYFDYSISDIWQQGKSNNTIQCIVDLGIETSSHSESLRFGPKGSSGTENTFLLEMLNGKNAIIANKGEVLPIKVILFNANGKEIVLGQEEAENIEWKLIHNDSGYLSYAVDEEDKTKIILTSNIDYVPSDNYTILSASYRHEVGEPLLTAYLPIPIKSKDCLGMSGATQVIYNNLGAPKYSESSYCAYLFDGEMLWNWILVQAETNPNPVTLKPSLINNAKEVSLEATTLYSSGVSGGPIFDKACVSCDGCWSQPILVLQSKYDFAMLNNWGEDLTIDTKNGTILSTMVGAGSKDSQGTFSGVLMGDVRSGTENNAITNTGIYGFQNGVMSYALRDDGSGFFGAGANGRIEFDGNSGIIRSSNWKKSGNQWILSSTQGNASGTLIDLDDGMFIAQSANGDYIKFNNNQSGTLEMSLSSLSIKMDSDGNYQDLDTFVSSKIDISANEIKTEVFSNQPSYTVHCSTPYDYPTKLLRFSRNDFEALCTLSEDKTTGVWNIPIGTIIEICCDGVSNTASTIDVQLGYSPPGETDEETGYPLIIGRSEVMAVNNPTDSLTNLLQYSGNDVFSIRYMGNKKFEVVTPSCSAITQTATEISSKVEAKVTDLQKQATYSATVSTLATPMELTLLNVPKNITADEFYKDGITLNVTIGPKYTGGELANKELAFLYKGKTVRLYKHGKYVGVNGGNLLTWKEYTTLCFMYRTSINGERWVLIDSGSYANYSEIKQTADHITASVGVQTDGSVKKKGNGFSMTIDANGFYLYGGSNNTQASSTNFIFRCNNSGVWIKGNGEFSGNLTAAETSFKKLKVDAIKIGGKQYISSFDSGRIILVAGKGDDTGTVNGTGGQLIIGSPDYSDWDDVTLQTRLIREENLQSSGYGNIGTPNEKWSTIYVASNSSVREIKENIEIYNQEQAYEELKNIPIYTYKYKDAGDASQTLFLGTMIDYMPIEFMHTTSESDGTMFQPNNIIFWNIAVSQVMQQKLENLIDRVEYLEQKEAAYGIN